MTMIGTGIHDHDNIIRLFLIMLYLVKCPASEFESEFESESEQLMSRTSL